MRKIFNTIGIWLGNNVTIGQQLTFDGIVNPIFEFTGTWFVYLKSASTTAFKFRDDTKGTDIFVIDTTNDTIETKYHTIITNKVTQITFANSPYTATWGEDLEVDCTAGAVTVNLPTAVGNNGKTISITKVDVSVNATTVDGSTTETINGALTKSVVSQWESVTLKSNNSNITLR